MSDKSLISWTDATWNIATGCTRVSAGCDRCYIERTMPFRVAGRRFDGDGPGSSTGVLLHPERLDWPLRWRRPRLVFVNSLADLFHDDIPDDYIARVFAVMAWSYRHTFQVLTKRPGRMRSLLNSASFLDLVEREWCGVQDWTDARLVDPEYVDTMPRTGPDRYWPLPNVWVGVSVESQQWVHRIDVLRETPAAVRWVSAEPLLGPVDLCDCYPGGVSHGSYEGVQEHCRIHGRDSIDWVVAGGESGPGARPAHPDWFRSLRDQCQAASVPFHFKQWGAWRPYRSGDDPKRGRLWDTETGDPLVSMIRLAKHATGRELDGRTWDEYPATREAAVDV